MRQTVAETIRQLADATMKWRPILAARNLYVLLDGDEVNDADAVNRALRPYWEGLWRMAARGHYFLYKKPIRGKVSPSDSVVQPAIPNVFESNFVLSFVRGNGNDVSLAFSFPGPRGPVYPMSSYPMIQEFRAMLNGLTAKSRHWKGEYFFGYTWDLGGRDPVLVSRSCKRHHLWLFPRGVERSAKTLPPGLGDARTPGHMGRTHYGIRRPMTAGQSFRTKSLTAKVTEEEYVRLQEWRQPQVRAWVSGHARFCWRK